MSKLFAGIAVAVTTTAGFATYDRVEPREVARAQGSWHPVVARSGGIAEISDTRPDSTGGRGSLELTLFDEYGPEGLGEFEVFSRDTIRSARGGLRARNGGFGRLADLQHLSFEWYRESASTVPGLLTPALRVYVWDPDAGPDGAASVFVWEGVYNGYATFSPPAVATDQWVHADVTEDFFWRVPLFAHGAPVRRSFCSEQPSECFVFNRQLSEWNLGPNTVILGLSIAVGSGWDGHFKGYADLVRLDFAHGKSRTWDFEPCRRRACRKDGGTRDDDDDD